MKYLWQDIHITLFIKYVVRLWSLWMKSCSVIVQMKLLPQYFHMEIFLFLDSEKF